MNVTPNRLILFGVSAFVCIALMAISLAGLLGPFENIASVPLSLAQQGIGGITRRVTDFFATLGDLQNLRQRNSELERALVNSQAEIVELREIKAEYQRLASLVGYIGATTANRTYTTANVIAHDTTGLLRSIVIDKGTRDGITVGMPVVTQLGLVGRIYDVTATSARIQLITDVNSYVNARLQTTRGEGVVKGTPSGSLLMSLVPLTDVINEGDSVVTSGIGGNFPRGIPIGQVTNKRLDDLRLFQEAQVRSLIDFNRLEIVLVITNFEPEDTSAFPTPVAPSGPQNQ
jgi:rod shape-determining protein MreC